MSELNKDQQVEQLIDRVTKLEHRYSRLNKQFKKSRKLNLKEDKDQKEVEIEPKEEEKKFVLNKSCSGKKKKDGKKNKKKMAENGTELLKNMVIEEENDSIKKEVKEIKEGHLVEPVVVIST
jgi:hypothetical protein